MANIISQYPYIIDTAGAGSITTDNNRVMKIRWVGGTTAGHQAIITDANNKVFWESVASGANYVEESDFSTDEGQRNILNGLKVTVLGSGKLYIYF